MKENNNIVFLKIMLIIYALICFVYGSAYFFIPDFMVNMSGGQAVFHTWLRWSGGVLIALGIGAILTYKNPEHQGIFVTTLSLGNLFCALGLIWGLFIREEGAHLWFTAFPAALTFVMAILFWLARAKAKDILYPEIKQ